MATLHLLFMIGMTTLTTALNLKHAATAPVEPQPAAATPVQSLISPRHLLEPSLCQSSQAKNYPRTGSIWPAVLLARDLALSILALNQIGDSLALFLTVAAVQLCYVGFEGVVRYRRTVIEQIGVLAIDSIFFVMLLLKAVSSSANVTATARIDTLSPILIFLTGSMILTIAVFGLLAIFVKQPSMLKEAKPPAVKLAVASNEDQGLIELKQVDPNEQSKDEAFEYPKEDIVLPQEHHTKHDSPQGFGISEVELAIPNEQRAAEPEL